MSVTVETVEQSAARVRRLMDRCRCMKREEVRALDHVLWAATEGSDILADNAEYWRIRRLEKGDG